jgi:hypothetical protein
MGSVSIIVFLEPGWKKRDQVLWQKIDSLPFFPADPHLSEPKSSSVHAGTGGDEAGSGVEHPNKKGRKKLS